MNLEQNKRPIPRKQNKIQYDINNNKKRAKIIRERALFMKWTYRDDFYKGTEYGKR